MTTIPKDGLIFPGALALDVDAQRPASVANKLLFIVEAESPDELRNVASAGRLAMESELDRIRDEAFSRIRGDQWDRGRASRDVAQLMEFEWVAVPWADRPYSEVRREAESTLAARKNTKLWSQLPGDDAGIPKSSLDGQRASVLDERVFDRLTSAALRRDYGVRPGERLCGVGLLKRMGTASDVTDEKAEQRPAFHSAGHVASAPVRAAISRHPHGEGLLQAYLDALTQAGVDLRDHRISAGRPWREGEYACRWAEGDAAAWYPRVLPLRPGEQFPEYGLDGNLLYPSRLESVLGEAAADGAAAVARKTAEKALRELLRTCWGSAEPTAYYAMLHADGDRMGAVLDKMQTPEEHRALSVQLAARFADRCGPLVARYGGSMIYAGGDDVLAIVPVHMALDLARSLAVLFASALDGLAPAGSETPTLSVGLAIAHHLEPMDEVRRLAVRAERIAKLERNSLAVLLSKRSGGEAVASGRWDEDLPIDVRLARFTAAFADGRIAHATPYEVLAAIAPLEMETANGPGTSELQGVIESLVRRAVGRKVIDAAARVELNELIARRMQTSQPSCPLARARALGEELRIALDLAGSIRLPRRDEDTGGTP